MISRRGLLVGGASLFVAAPVIVRASSLMHLRGVPLSLPSPDSPLVRWSRVEFTHPWCMYLGDVCKLDEVSLISCMLGMGVHWRFVELRQKQPAEGWFYSVFRDSKEAQTDKA